MTPSCWYTGISQKPKIQNKFCLFCFSLSLVRFIYIPRKFDDSFLKFDCMGILFSRGTFVPCLKGTFELHFDFWLQSMTMSWGTWDRRSSSSSVSGVLTGNAELCSSFRVCKIAIKCVSVTEALRWEHGSYFSLQGSLNTIHKLRQPFRCRLEACLKVYTPEGCTEFLAINMVTVLSVVLFSSSFYHNNMLSHIWAHGVERSSPWLSPHCYTSLPSWQKSVCFIVCPFIPVCLLL